MIGISFYLNDSLAEERIIQAGERGVKRAFTSLHIPEESGDLAGRAKKLLQLAKDCGIEVFADVSYHTPAHLGLDSLFALKELGVTGLRLDDFFEHDLIISLATEFKLAVNASILFEEDLKRLLNSGLKSEQLIGWHNFYPRVETGLSEDFFTQQNELYKRYNIPISAYIPGAGEKRGPIGEGLPTLENHRDTDPFLAALELFQSGVDEVYIGDPDHGHGLLEKLMRMASESTVALRVEGGFTHCGQYQLRPDLSRDVLRFMNTRNTESVVPKQTVSRTAGSITMDNDLYGRYRGEIQITLRDLPADKRVNVIGKVTAEDVQLLSSLKPGMLIELV
ncbi:MAG: MupG family TIM beta-alpha barrel fold protein [Bacillota bacterium]